MILFQFRFQLETFLNQKINNSDPIFKLFKYLYL